MSNSQLLKFFFSLFLVWAIIRVWWLYIIVCSFSFLQTSKSLTNSHILRRQSAKFKGTWYGLGNLRCSLDAGLRSLLNHVDPCLETRLCFSNLSYQPKRDCSFNPSITFQCFWIVLNFQFFEIRKKKWFNCIFSL